MRTMSTLQIEDDLAAGPRATQQRIAACRGLQRVRLVVHRARQQAGFAGMADPRTTGPSSRYVTSFGQLQQARVRRIPRHGQAAPGERDHWP